MIRISKLADYAVLILGCMVDDKNVQSASSLADTTHLSETTVAKVLKMLARDNIVTSSRGATGGYVIARDAATISMHDVIAAIDGPIAVTDCIEGGKGDCALESTCRMQTNWSVFNDTIKQALHNLTLEKFLSHQNMKKVA